MLERTLKLDAPDGSMPVFVVHPERHGPHPVALVMMDGLGMREALRDQARRLASVGYYVMLPDLYYRSGPAEPIDRNAPDAMDRIMALVRSVTAEKAMAEAVAQAKADGITHIIFGDLFLEDIRAYRVEKLKETGITPVFPLWLKPTDALARDMIAGGLQAHLATVDLKKLSADFAGRRFDDALLGDLPAGIDPCGENGEFHSFVFAGPMLSRPIPVRVGETVERDGFAYADLLAA